MIRLGYLTRMLNNRSANPANITGKKPRTSARFWEHFRFHEKKTQEICEVFPKGLRKGADKTLGGSL
jgi:hypothetical protein